MTTQESERSTLRAPSWAGLGITGVGVVQFLADGARGGAVVLVAALLCGAAIAAVAVPELRHGRDGAFGLVYPAVYMGGAALLGWVTRQRADAADLRDRGRRQAAQLAVAEERARLAREMHDVISHGVSLMVVQAEAGNEVLPTRPEAAASALEAIAATGRSAMGDLHRMLGLLRDSAAEDLDALAVRVRAAGMEVLVEVHPGWSSLAEPTCLALFRVAQEAITNTLRHAAAAQKLSIRYRQDAELATLEARDDGTGMTVPPGTPGTGLAGLRRRLADLGGTLDTSEAATGGFLVRAALPLVPR